MNEDIYIDVPAGYIIKSQQGIIWVDAVSERMERYTG